MNIPPNSIKPIPNNDPSKPPSDPANAPIEKLPAEILGHIISFVNDDKGVESAASTKKPLTKITVDEAKKNSTNEINELVKNFSELMDKLVSNIVDKNAVDEANDSIPEADKKAILEKNKKAIEQVKNLRQEILAFSGGKVLGSDNLSVNLLDVKSSMINAKIDLAKLISKLGKIEGTQVLNEGDVIDIVGTSMIANDIMYLAECYLQIDEWMPFEDGFVPSGLIKKLIAAGDLPEAFKVAAFSYSEPFNFSQELQDKKIPESILDKIEMVVDKLPNSKFKTKSLLFLSEKHLENGNLEKAEKITNNLNTI